MNSYIHGGAWRDPRLTAADFQPSVDRIRMAGSFIDETVQGFVSIDYRLSPHPEFPQDSATPSSDLRVAQHPDHIQDIRSALDFVQTKYDISDNYVLVGHSAGATLAFQLLMGDSVLAGQPLQEVLLPKAIIGISGIYGLVDIDTRHDGQYAGFISAAFGEDKAKWATASPVQFNGNFREKWPNGALIMLAWSPEDTLIDEPEIDNMTTKLRNDGIRTEVCKTLVGDHDDVWRNGRQLARLVEGSLRLLEHNRAMAEALEVEETMAAFD
jgi:kynurenine formamidase